MVPVYGPEMLADLLSRDPSVPVQENVPVQLYVKSYVRGPPPGPIVGFMPGRSGLLPGTSSPGNSYVSLGPPVNTLFVVNCVPKNV